MANRFATIARNVMSQIMSGRQFSIGDTLTFYRRTRTIDQMGRASAVATSSYSITGEIQFITADDHELIDAGWAQVGDARMYTFDSSNLTTDPIEGDEIQYKGDWFELFKKVEAPEVGSDMVFQSWLLKRRRETGDTTSP